ncbi:MAG TPA: T9SS type A sorting domain-containing protein, partial [Flavisolibacter sp.]|nr:T9SS type A sorting domain-containing protein [Flavisolibacter sp.]
AYAFTDTTLLTGKAHYRLAMVTTDGKKSYSPAIQLTNNNEVFALGNVVNPFRETVSFSVTVAKDTKVEVALVNQAGLVLKQQSYPLRSGANSLSLQQLGNLPSGIYILQVRSEDKIINQKVMKK